MSAIGEAFAAIRRIVLMDANIERLDAQVSELSDNVDGLASGLAGLSDRVARLEGFIQGAAAASQVTPRLPRD